ncbi:hypothetical protein ME1_00203 [Bartonella vinsonii subsp. arupensis OK-94-513]|uniref:Surface protein/Bartonella adhesin n=2 Tax=Bartonella vinsonii subsp. arupensis TaxID=110578 RepID=J0ZLZ7_BARVI|nr:Vomp family autotransporter [Bartonella vinsonii]AAU44778.1 BrpB [Bartonella vinsonii subsp. arupensis]EJF89433.1 hypothetical protein ME1_00203 [Bartonella vinsonii subsp. arupensis OK-94-513]
MKKYSTPNLIKAVSLGTVIATLLSSVSPVVAANLAITGQSVQSTNGTDVSYPKGSHGSIVLAGDNDYCGVFNVIGRGGMNQGTNKQITEKEAYEIISLNKEVSGKSPFNWATGQIVWAGDGTTNSGGYMGGATGGLTNVMPEAFGVYSFATGCGSSASGHYSTAFGAGATAKLGAAQAFGVFALAGGQASLAIGVVSEASGRGAIAIGGFAKATDIDGMAFGTQSLASASDAIAVGYDAQAQKEKSIAIGPNARAIVEGGVAIGSGSVANTSAGVIGYDPLEHGPSKNEKWKSTLAAVSVGNPKNSQTRQITGVAAGTADTDAANVAQVKALESYVDQGWNLSVGGENSTTIGIKDTVDLSAASDNLTVTKDVKGNNVKFDLAKNITVTSVTAGKSILSDDGFLFTNGGPAITSQGIHAGNQTITDVAAGTADTDAVNVAQLNAVKEAAKTSWQLSINSGDAMAIGPNGMVNLQAAGSENKQNIKIVRDNDHNVTFGLADDIHVTSVTAGKSVMNDQGFHFEKGGPEVTPDGIDAGNKRITGLEKGNRDTDAVNVAQLKEIENQVAENSLVKWDDAQKRITIGAEKDGIEINIANNEGKVRLISGVEIGEISSTSTDAINGHQLFQIAKNVSDFFGDDADVINGIGPTYTIQGSKYTTVVSAFEGINNSITKISNQITNAAKNSLVKQEENEGTITIGKATGGDLINIANKNSEDRRISGVKAAEEDNDAVNKKQLEDSIADITDSFKNNSLVKQEAETNRITIGKEIEGTEIHIANKSGEARTISGVKAAVNADEAVNKQQLDGEIADITDRIKVIKEANSFAVLYDKKSDNSVNYNSITLGGEETKEPVALHNVKNGDINEDSTDAINGGQLWKTNDRVAGVEKEIAHIDNKVTNISATVTDLGKEVFDIQQASAFAVLYDKNDDDSVNYNSITLGGDKTTEPVALLNVKDGRIAEDSHDAINGSQINKISGDIAKSFGGNAAFQDGKFVGPQYNLSTVSADGKVTQKTFEDVGSALTGLDANVKNVNSHLDNVVNEFTQKIDGVSKDSLLWSDDEQAFVALHGPGEEKTNSKIKFLADGEISSDSTDAITGKQLYSVNNKLATYLGGGTQYENEEWTDPTFTVSELNADGAIVEEEYDNVADAFTGVSNSITKISNHITNAAKNSLVKQEGESSLITIGKETAGTEISIVNKNGDVRTISGVKNGTLSEDSTDAVNGSQLFKIAENISNYFGGSTDVAAGIEPTFVIKDTKYNNVTDAFTGVNISIANLDGKISEMKKGNLVQQEGGASGIITIGAKTAGTEINIAGVGGVARTISGVKKAEKGDEAVNKDQLDKSIEKISQDINLASAAAVLYDKSEDGVVDYNRVTLGGKNSTGPVALLNVKDGRIADGSTDAITGNQLYRMSNQLAAYFGGGAGYNDGEWTAPNFKVAQLNADGTTVEKSYNNVADALGGVNSNMVSINDRIDHVIDKVDSDALKWNDLQQAYDAKHDGKPSKIINVADGKIEQGSKDAVNGGQLWKTNERVAGVEKDIQHITNKVDNISATVTNIGETVINIEDRVDNIENTVNNLSDGAVNYDKTADGKKTNKITLKGGDASEPVLIDNLADGRIEKGSKEAINGGQLHDYTEQQMKIVLDESKHYTDQRVNNIVIDAIDNAVDQANQYTDMKFNILSYDIKSVRKEARQAAAVGLAVSNLRYFDDPGSLSVSFGSGAWRGQSAFALGAGYTSENGKIRSNISATSAGGHWGVGGAITLKIK